MNVHFWSFIDHFPHRFTFRLFCLQMSTTMFLSSCHPPMRPQFLKELRLALPWLRFQPQTWTPVCMGWYGVATLKLGANPFHLFLFFQFLCLLSADSLYHPERRERRFPVLQHRLSQWSHCHSCLFWPRAEGFVPHRGSVAR